MRAAGQAEDCEIAIVDDDHAVLDSFRFMLETRGLRVTTYSSALDLLCADADPCCLILDHHMPAMTGLELSARLRAKGSVARMLLVTAAPTPGLVAEALRIGIEQVLEKPPSDQAILLFVASCGRAGAAGRRRCYGCR